MWLQLAKTSIKSIISFFDRQFGQLNTLLNYQNFIITGIPRSGTSLFCSVMNSAENCYCFNEVHHVPRLQTSLFLAQRRLRRGRPVRNKFEPSGDVTADTHRNDFVMEHRRGDEYGDDLVVGTKKNIPFLNQIEFILAVDISVFALIRDPLFTLLSWNSSGVANIPEARLDPHYLEVRYDDITFESENRFDMQAQIWNHFAGLIWDYRSNLQVVTYERLTGETERTVREIASELGLHYDDVPALENRNRLSRYETSAIDEIRASVDQYCSVRKRFGYDRST